MFEGRENIATGNDAYQFLGAFYNDYRQTSDAVIDHVLGSLANGSVVVDDSD